MNRLEEIAPKMKSSSSFSDESSSSPMPSSPAFETTPTHLSSKDRSMSFLDIFDFKTLLIIILLFVLLFSYLGINILTILGEMMERFVKFVSPMITEFLVLTGYSTGSVLNKTADVVSDTAKETIDIAEGAVQNVGNLLMDAGSKRKTNDNTNPMMLKDSLKQNTSDPEPDAPENTIQKPITSTKYNWCLVGEYQNKRGCMPITESDKCLSGQVFPTQKMCLNPNLTP